MIEFADFGLLAVQLLVVVFLVEAITETVKAVFKGPKNDAAFKDTKKLSSAVEFYLALTIGILAAVLLQISIFDTSNLVVFYVGCVLAGAIASRGANHMHDILKTLSALPKKK